MSQVILHHYQLSPYSEKIRLALGLKGLNWRSVEIPVWTPRPKLTPMTGGYRRTPILQIGAEFHCDTLLILHVIEKLGGSGTLYPRGQEGLAKAFGWWIEKGTFMNAVCLTIGNMGGKIPQELVDERRPFFRVDLEPRHCSANGRCTCKGSMHISPGSPKFSPMAASSSLARTLLRPIYQHITRSGLHGRMAARK